MHPRELPVLDDTDERLEDRFAMGLGADAARVLTYLVLRADSETDSPVAATRPEVQIGTGLGRDVTVAATNRLTDRGLVSTKRVQSDATELTRKAWAPVGDREQSLERVFDSHAAALLENAATVDDRVGFTGGAGDGSAGADGEVSVALNWAANPVHFPVLVAADRGAFASRGLDVSLTEHHGSGPAMAAVTSGGAEAGIVGPATLVQASEGGDGALPVALLYQRSMVVLYTTREAFGGRFESVEQLRGRRVAMAMDSETGLLARLFLSQAGVLADVQVEPIEAEERDVLLAGDADVAVGVFLDPLVLERDGATVDTTLVAESFPIPGPAIVARRRTVEERPGDIRALLAGIGAGWAIGATDPETVRTVLPEAPHAAEFTRRLAETFNTSDTVTEHGWGWQTPDQWTRLKTALREADVGQ